MHMLRHYFISDNLDDLELLEEQLEAAGVCKPQIHVLSSDDAEVQRHAHLHAVQSFMKKDVVHATELGALAGICAFVLVLGVAYFAGWTDSPAGWTPFIFLAVVLLGFCTWEGGLIGIQEPNHNFTRFEQALKDGKHVFFVDLEPGQEAILEGIRKRHSQLQDAGTGTSTPHWLIALWQKTTAARQAL
jgi:hypothetical protein